MQTFRRILGTTILVAFVYALTAVLVGPTRLVDLFVTVTAINKWHPNWPAQSTVHEVANTSPSIAILVAAASALLYVALTLTGAFRVRPLSPTLGSAAMGGPVAMAGFPEFIRPQTAQEFQEALLRTLQEAGVGAPQAEAAVSAAMELADTADPGDWASRVRERATALAGVNGRFFRVHSQEPHLDATARFLREYGFLVLRFNTVFRRKDQAPLDRGLLDFDGLAIGYRSTATVAEESLVELLITAHQAHLAAMEDTGLPSSYRILTERSEALHHVAAKLALRGFVPPELDAEVGRDGVATADELEQWAVAQVVATASPLAVQPLPTVERAS